MGLDLFRIAALFWGLALLLAASRRSQSASRGALACGIIAALGGCLACALVDHHTPASLVTSGAILVRFRIDPAAAWLLGWGLVAALAAVCAGVPAHRPRLWTSGAALSLLGALGVAGVQDGVSFLIAWEIMSLGGAALLLGDRQGPVPQNGRAVLFMLALLEVGSVALLASILILGARHPAFASWPIALRQAPDSLIFVTGVLLIVGFGAKLGLLPFYEWYPAAYGSASGATGALLSGVILNAAWFGLARGVFQWLPRFPGLTAFGALLVVIGTLTAVLAILYAFQQEDWRRLLAFSSAENAAVAVVALGAAVLFRRDHLPLLEGFAFTVGLLHLGGHSLAKGTLMLSADHVHETRGHYRIAQSRVLAQNPWTLGLGALCAVMSLAALPPQAGFVSEWYLFQTVFQDFRLHGALAQIALAFAGAGLALTAAIALATMAKLFGIGLLGKNGVSGPAGTTRRKGAILVLGLAVLGYAVGMPWWIQGLVRGRLAHAGHAAARLVHGLILVPLNPHFAFISPTLLVIVGPLLALIPLGLLAFGMRSGRRVAPIWAHGLRALPRASATTALAFSNALREFYSFVYRPRTIAERRTEKRPYFIKAVRFEYGQTALFGPTLFTPATRLVRALAQRVSILQRGSMNAYLAYIGVLLLLVLSSVFWR
jgi:formate hydrogenlyase subunit 3/multisubunit Na+/H+ antiporter MnhD subunit